MKLESYTNYAMRSLQFATLKAPDLVRIECTRIHNLLRTHIMKNVHKPGKAEYLATLPGRSVRFRHARRAKEIMAVKIIGVTEHLLDIARLLNLEKTTCPLMVICIFWKKTQHATTMFLALLDDLKVADIAAIQGQLLDRIGPLEAPSNEKVTS